TRSLLEVYLGPNASASVLAGQFRRGTGREIRAAIWFCDMRGFTELSDQRPPRDVVHVLDQYFEHVAAPIERHGGEILKLIGDAALAIFPIHDPNDSKDACERALAAAQEVLASFDRWPTTAALPRVALGVAVHVGEVMY